MEQRRCIAPSRPVVTFAIQRMQALNLMLSGRKQPGITASAKRQSTSPSSGVLLLTTWYFLDKKLNVRAKSP